MATDIFGVSGRAMTEALIAGQRDPTRLVELARGRLRVKHAPLVQALTGRFDGHHAELVRMLLDQIDALKRQRRFPKPASCLLPRCRWWTAWMRSLGSAAMWTFFPVRTG